ncbi:AB hydrolase-1 domain-containing protein [Favolaschia claudopus]|uniref:AB hydrolase-1 domain-containing protein n=1 Tax=Favolaschia claudopus TaxID=2862362 RepID=A0AAW0D9C4_9AGAR
MPHVDLETSETFFYTIATPSQPSASQIIQALPTLVLIHPAYTGSAIFHSIYANRHLRRFNLVSMDLRGHGWTSATVDDSYSSETVADDVLRLMDRLKIFNFHVAGISTGGSIALQLAIAVPERILSVFMMSAAPQHEPAESMQGRHEIARYWVQAHQPNANAADKVAAEDAIYGSLQLAYSNMETPLIRAIRDYSIEKAEHNWTRDNLHYIELLTIQFHLNQPIYTFEMLRRIRCPMLLVHCSEDFVYPRIHAEELLNLLRTANVDVKLETIEGAPHWGNVTHPDETNTLLYNFVTDHCNASDLPLPPDVVESPFSEELARHGFQDGDVESD